MQKGPEIAIIGGGLIGLSCADSLNARGAKVTVFEQNDEIGLGASQYNSGMIHPSQAAPWLAGNIDVKVIKSLAEFAGISRDLLMQRRRGLGCSDVLRPPGTLQLFEKAEASEHALGFYQKIGIPATRTKSPWAFGRHALEFPKDQSGDAYEYTRRLGKDLEKRGVNMRTGQFMSGLQIEEVMSRFDYVIMACGAHSAELLLYFDIDLPVKPVTGHALVFERPNVTLPDIPIMHRDSHSAMTVFEDRLRLSGTVDENTPDILRQIWLEIAPEIIGRLGPPIIRWTANRPASQLGRPVMDSAGIPGLYICTGHGHMGWSLCAASGALMADMILEGREAPDFAMA